MSTQPSRLHIPIAQSDNTVNLLIHTGQLVERSRPLWVAALMPLFVLGEGRYLSFGVVGVVALWIVAGATTGVWGRWSAASAAMLAMLALIPITLWVSPSQELTYEHLGYLLAQLISLYAVWTWATTRYRVQLLAYSLVGIGCVLAASAPLIMQSAGAPATVGFLPDTIQKNVLAGLLVVLLPVSLGLLMGKLASGQTRAAVIAALAPALMLLAIVFAQSHGAYLALFVSLFVMGIVKGKVIRFAAPVILFVGGVAVWLLSLGAFLADLLQSDSVGNFSVRLEIWSRALQVIHDFPLTGIGLGAFRTAVPALYPYVVSEPDKVHHAHNLYLNIGAELGLPGLAVFLAFVICLLIAGTQSYKLWTRLQDREFSWLTVGCLGALAALLSHGLLDAVTWGTKPSFVAWAVLGLLLSLPVLAEKEQRLA